MLRSVITAIVVVAVFMGIYILSSYLKEKVMHEKSTFGCLGTGDCGSCMQECEKRQKELKMMQEKAGEINKEEKINTDTKDKA